MPRVELNITEEEKEIMIKVLESCISDFTMEIADTDKMDYREKLKQNRSAIKKLLVNIQEAK